MRALTVDDRLEAIAGPPAGLLTEPGTTDPLEGFDGGASMTLYIAWQHAAQSSGYYAIASMRDPTTLYLLVESRPSGAAYEARVDTGSSVSYARPAPTVKPVMAAALRYDSAQGVATIEYATGESGAVSVPGLTVPGAVQMVVSPDRPGEFSRACAALYPTIHTGYQRTMILRKLTQMSEEQ